jgi:hypothetical protein
MPADEGDEYGSALDASTALMEAPPAAAADETAVVNEVAQVAAPDQPAQNAPSISLPFAHTEAEAAPVVEQPPVKTEEPAASVEETAKDGEFEIPTRFYTKHLAPEQKALLEVMLRNPDMAPEQAAALANEKLGRHPVQAAEPVIHGDPQMERHPEAVANDDPLALAQAELQEVTRKLNDLAGDEGIGTVFNAEVNTLNNRRAELIADIKIEERTRRARASVVERLQAEQAQSAEELAVIQAHERYPDLSNDNTPLAQAANARVSEMLALQKAAEADPSLARNPDVALALAKLNHPNFATLIADEVAAEVGVSPAQAKPGANGKHSPTSNPQGGTPAANGAPQAKPGPVPVSGQAGAAHRVVIRESNPQDVVKESLAQAGDDYGSMGAALESMLGGAAAGKSIFIR